MGSNKGNGRGDGSKRRPGDLRRSRQGRPNLEPLEQRRLLSNAPAIGPPGTAPVGWHPTNTNPLDVENGPLANMGQQTIHIYQEYNAYLQGGSKGAFVSSLAHRIQFQGTSVGLDLRFTGDLATYQQVLNRLGVNVVATNPALKVVEGYVPIGQLVTIAREAQTLGGEPNYKPVVRFAGKGNNQAETAIGAAAARLQFGVDGAGQKIGVISDSVGRVGAGLAQSVASGDLPANVQVLLDGVAGATDEGRAMLENIYDIAPGAALAFHTGGPGDVAFGNAVVALADAGSTIITDDLGYADEPFFQDGPAQIGINTVTARGIEFTSAAGNAADSGYLSQFRGVNGTVPTIGAGRFMNFDPTGATQTTLLPIEVYQSTTPTFQFDQPIVAGGNGVTSQMNFYVLDQNNAIVSQGISNTVAAGLPLQIVDRTITPGKYNVVIQLVSGPDPGHVQFMEPGDGGFNVSHQFGTAGGTSYPSVLGHAGGGTTISVGAVPYFNTPAYGFTGTLHNEDFSSFGTELSLFNPDGSPKTPQVLLKPDISAPDGGNTSFFGQILDTTNPFPGHPPFTGQPPTTIASTPTATNVSQPGLPSFFGTSAATENAAAVIALLKQANPSASQFQIVSALISTALPLNGQAPGTYNVQGGFGEINPIAAFKSLSGLSVSFISPGASQTVAQAPTSVFVTFSKPIDINSISSGNLFIQGPNGATVAVGQPVGVDSVKFPTQVRFPIAITPAPGQIANGVYNVHFIRGAIVGQNGQPLLADIFDRFTLNQVNGPQVASTSFVGRIVTVTFNEGVNAATVTPANITLVRGSGLVVSNLPQARFSYNPATFTATIDLTGVPQSSLPTDTYTLRISRNVTDLIGNPLNGSFAGVFPSGVFPSGAGSDFVQALGLVQLSPPVISNFSLAPQSDSGIGGDNDTNNQRPSLIGQVTARFPSSLAGLTVLVEFNGIPHAGVRRGGLDLKLGGNRRGFSGQFDVMTTTDALGRFTINYPANAPVLPEGENLVRVVVIGQPDQPPFPGFSDQRDTAFRVDKSLPYIGTVDGTQATSIAQGANINGLSSLTLDVVDPVNPGTPGDPFAVGARVTVPALNPSIANNLSSYALFLVNPNGTLTNESSFISTATFTSPPASPTPGRTLTSDPYTGQITLTFAPGLPTGSYKLQVLSSDFGAGLSDAAGNPFAGDQAHSSIGRAADFVLDFNLQPTPTYITNYQAFTPDAATPGGSDSSGPRAFYELPASGQPARAAAPPTAFAIDFSNSLNNFGGDVTKATAFYSNVLQLVRSANSATANPDGAFGDLGITNTTGFTRVNGITVSLVNSIASAQPGQYGYQNRLFVSLPAGLTLPADYYRLYLSNAGQAAIRDIFGNQLDGEFLGYQGSNNVYVDQLPNGQVRGSAALPDLTGDGINGGAFMTGFVVVANGNVIFASADAPFNAQIASQIPNGSAARPYPVLASEAVPNQSNGGDLNSIANAGGKFDPTLDRSGDGQFEPSAFFAAQQRVLATNNSPVVIVAEPSLPTLDFTTGQTIQRPFVLQAPSGADPVANNGSASVPALTTLVFQPGAILKMQNASLFVQNQGSALQVLGGPNSFQRVTITSYKDSSIGGVTNGDPNSKPAPGDYGGVILRNFSQAALPGDSSPRSEIFNGTGQLAITGNPLLDDRLKGPFSDVTNPSSQADAVSGADDIMSYVTYLTERYAGGPVPQTNGIRYDGITLKNSRPTIINSTIADAGGAGSAQAGLSVDVDSLRVDDVARGPLLRGDTFVNNGLNGIYIRAEVSGGVAEATNAVAYPINPSNLGGSKNFALDDPYPYLLTSRLVIGDSLLQGTGNGQSSSRDRLYVNPGMVLKFERGAALQIRSGASLNVGDTTYLKNFDADPTYGPTFAARKPDGSPNPNAGKVNPNFVTNSPGLARVIFTSLEDDAATTSFFDPISQARTTIVQPLAAEPGGAGANQPRFGNVPARARWGGVSLASGSIDVINSAVFRYGGGQFNTDQGTGTENVLNLGGSQAGSHVILTNSFFTDNLDVPINLDPNALLAGDPQRPLESGDPFIHGNLFFNNGINGVGVQGGTDGLNRPNLLVNSVWTGSDFTYILRDTIVLGPRGTNTGGSVIPPTPITTVPLGPLKPNLTLTLQSTLPGTILADGTTVAAPGVPLVIKLQGGFAPEAPGTNPTPAIPNSFTGGAGFIVGVDNGIDPPALDPLVDPGAFSQIRIVGIGANQTTGQTRIPVIITSIHDSSVGTTVGNMVMNQAIPGDGQAPARGDGGIIYFGGNSLTSYNLQDPRSGSLIDNADIRYITRIEQQGGGVLYTFDTNNSGNFSIGDGYATKLGQFLPGGANLGAQYNQAKQLTISNSNLSSFSDAGFVAHPGYDTLGVTANFVNQSKTLLSRIGGFRGEATHTYFVNNTFSNMPNNAVEITSENSPNVNDPSPAMAVFLNNTFYNVGTAIATFAPTFNGTNDLSHVSFLAMDNIFSKVTGAGGAVVATGQDYGSQLQYNLFNAITGPNATGLPNFQPILGDPSFRDPTNGNFALLPNSAAIDVARSELGPSIFGDMLFPVYTVAAGQDPSNARLPLFRNQIGDSNPFGGLGFIPSDSDIVTLPGEPVMNRGFLDQFIPVLSTAAGATAGTASNAATFQYAPLQGERDQAGNLRVKDPNSPNVGFGSRPFFDLGAFEYIIQNPPVVTAVQAVVAAGPPVNLYRPGAIAGTNQPPQQIQIRFNEQLDPNTINASSVILQASGGAGVFGDPANPNSRNINLAGLLSFDPKTDILTINTSGIFRPGAQLNDEYRLILKGTGPNVIRDLSGLALDGFTNNDTTALPSGSDQFPGSDFSVTFTINTNSPSLVGGTFRLDPASDSSGGRNITNVTMPTFTGTIIDIFPPANALLNQIVILDVSTRGDGIFDQLNAGMGLTNAQGQFSIKLTQPLPNTPFTIGTDGIQGDPGARYTEVRVRVINGSGNASAQVTDPLSTFANAGALAFLQEDTTSPTVSAFSPLANTVASVNNAGQVVVSVTFTKNIKASTLNANSIMVRRSGGTGTFGPGSIAVPIITSSFTTRFLGDATGSEVVTFALQGPLPNDVYQISLKGVGTAAITDIPGNPLAGVFTGTFPTGGGTNQGSDFVNTPVTIFQPTQSHLIYVEAPTVFPAPVNTAQIGSRANPFTTIGAAMGQALIGDDVLVLPGVYRESVTVKAGVRLLSADPSSTSTTFLPGNPLATLIYGVPNGNGGTGQGGTGTANGLGTFPGQINTTNNNIITVFTQGAVRGVPTEIRGFSIISPLIGDRSTGTIDPTNNAIEAVNSNVLIDRNFIINAGIGVDLGTSGVNAATATVEDNVIAGNINGIGITDLASTTSIATPFLIVNNTIADNTTGLYNISSSPGSLQAYVENNIFFSNHDLTTARNGTGIASGSANTLGVGFNLFFNNGNSIGLARASANAQGAFGAFVPGALAISRDILGNFIGNPAFVAARDPRPNGDTPNVFFNTANYDLSGTSTAINAANQAAAPTTDILYRSPVPIAGHGFPNTGPASIGAYYYRGTGGPGLAGGVAFGSGSTGSGTGAGTGSSPGTGTGAGTGSSPGAGTGSGPGGIISPGSGGSQTNPNPIPQTTVGQLRTLSFNAAEPMIGGGQAIGTRQFNVVTTSLSDQGTAHASETPGVIATRSAPSFIDVDFSDNINPDSLGVNDLVLSGSGIDPSNPARATSLAWVDNHTVRFFLNGAFVNSGTVDVSIPQGALIDTDGASLLGFNDSIRVTTGTTPTAVAVASNFQAPAASAFVASPALIQPLAVAGPIAVPNAPHHAAKHATAKAIHATSVKDKSHTSTHHHETSKHPKAPKVVHSKGHNIKGQ